MRTLGLWTRYKVLWRLIRDYPFSQFIPNSFGIFLDFILVDFKAPLELFTIDTTKDTIPTFEIQTQWITSSSKVYT